MSDQLGLFAPGELPETPRRGGPVDLVDVDEEHRELARRRPPGLYLGTSSWSFPGWTGILWDRPASQRQLARHGLAAYARHPLLNGVGLDRSYYQPLPAEEYAAYATVVPEDFRFVVKAHEACTVARWPEHERYGSRRGLDNPLFLDPAYAADQVVAPYAEGLGTKGGALVFQFAPQDLGGVDRFINDLYRFLVALPAGPTYAVELRNREVMTERYVALLRETGAVHCVNRHPRMPGVDVQASAVAAADSPAFLCRWMLRPGLTYQGGYRRYHPFDRLVDEDLATRRSLAEIAVATTAAGRPAYVTANNKAEGCAPLTLFRLAEEVARHTGAGAATASRGGAEADEGGDRMPS
jgi:uncharacterized protein YecE (DUF72 family)